MDCLQLDDAHFGIDGGCFELGVSEQLLDVADVGAAFEQVRGAGVAKQVRSAFVPCVGRLDVLDDLAAEHVGIERLAIAGQEQGLSGGILFDSAQDRHYKQRPHVVQVFLEPAQGALAHRDNAVLAAFAKPDA